jgi:flap endonuclease-1
MENGIKPIWVFDGKPPDMKAKELDKRKELKNAAEEERKEAENAGDWERAK